MKVELFEPPTGTDLTVVNAARVSFAKRSDWLLTETPFGTISELSEADQRLIKFLARGMTAEDFEAFKRQSAEAAEYGDYEMFVDLLWSWRRTPTHFAPFAHPHVTFHVTAPLFVARQLGKHQVGMVWSEVSRRYVDSEPEFYVPETWRKRAEDIKQGSSEETVDVKPYNLSGFQLTEVGPVKFCIPIDDTVFNQLCLDYYNHKLAQGVCPEQARMNIPQSMMTEWVWTGSLYAWANVYNQRKPGGHAQRETQEIAKQIGEHMLKHFPISWEALTA